MNLLIDVFGYADVLLRGLSLLAQSLTVGGIAFLVFLARPLAPLAPGSRLGAEPIRFIGFSALALLVIEALRLSMLIGALIGTTGIDFQTAIGASFVFAGTAKMAAALLIAILALGRRPSGWALAVLALVILAAASAMSHSVARLEDRAPLAALFFLHQLGAAVWIGGIPFFLLALARADGTPEALSIGSRFSAMAMASVALLVAAGLGLGLMFIGSFAGLYGTAYGAMVSTKVILLGCVLALGAANFFLVRRARLQPATPLLPMRRFAEAEVGLGVAIFLAAASLTSTPPAIDLPNDRATWDEITDRNAPKWPSFKSPSHNETSIQVAQQKLDAAAGARTGSEVPRAFVPGAGIPPPSNAADIAWSEFNHHWSGIFVLLAGLLALAERAGAGRWARHWPLAFIGLAIFLLIRSDPKAWPLGSISFWESMRDAEALQHRLSISIVALLGIFEWAVRTGRIRSPRAALVFPLLCGVGGTLLLTHSHSIANVKEELLIELTHLPIAVLGLVAGWARWLELRLDPQDARPFSWIWPASIAAVGALLLLYRES